MSSELHAQDPAVVTLPDADIPDLSTAGRSTSPSLLSASETKPEPDAYDIKPNPDADDIKPKPEADDSDSEAPVPPPSVPAPSAAADPSRKRKRPYEPTHPVFFDGRNDVVLARTRFDARSSRMAATSS